VKPACSSATMTSCTTLTVEGSSGCMGDSDQPLSRIAGEGGERKRAG
jgi:hypothetical protein